MSSTRAVGRIGRACAGALAGVGAAVVGVAPVAAQRVGNPADNRIENQVAVFAALDKVTARISKLEIPLGQSVSFGALTVSPRSCFTRSPLEAPKTSSFVEVSEKQLDGQSKKIFGGWMFAESPGLNAVEHPVYDVWLTDCAKPRVVAATPPAASGRPKGQPQPAVRAQGQAAPPQGQPAPAPQPQAAPQPGPAAADQPADDFKRRRPPR